MNQRVRILNFFSICTFFVLLFYVGISPDADIPHDLVVSGSKDCSVKVWNMNQTCVAAVLTCRGHTACVNCVAVRENIAASAADDCSVRVWDIVTVWLHFNFLFGTNLLKFLSGSAS